MRISLLMSTYERADALAAVLESVKRQTRPPDEVVVGDDGSGRETADVIAAAAKAGLPIKHEWQENKGFRLARIRNLCLAAATGDYAVIVDGDVLLHPEFIADHARAAEKGFFVQGSRVMLEEAPTVRGLKEPGYWPSFWGAGVGNRKNLIRSPFFARLLARPVEGLKGIRTSNFAVWRENCVRVNGFNEDFVGWGREDSEFVTRLLNAGVRRRNLRFAAAVCHLYHPPRSGDGLAKNDALLAAAVDAGASRCENGLNLHMKRQGAE